jgi:hypothetical protein
MTATYAYGIESFEDLTADRIRNLGGQTLAASVRVRMAIFSANPGRASLLAQPT